MGGGRASVGVVGGRPRRAYAQKTPARLGGARARAARAAGGEGAR